MTMENFNILQDFQASLNVSIICSSKMPIDR